MISTTPLPFLILLAIVGGAWAQCESEFAASNRCAAANNFDNTTFNSCTSCLLQELPIFFNDAIGITCNDLGSAVCIREGECTSFCGACSVSFREGLFCIAGTQLNLGCTPGLTCPNDNQPTQSPTPLSGCQSEFNAVEACLAQNRADDNFCDLCVNRFSQVPDNCSTEGDETSF